MRVADTDTARGGNYTPFISGLTTSEVKAQTGSLNQTLYIQEKIANGLYKRKPFCLHAGLNFWTGHRLLLHVKGPLFSATRTLSAETPAKARGWIEDTRSSPALQSFRAAALICLKAGRNTTSQRVLQKSPEYSISNLIPMPLIRMKESEEAEMSLKRSIRVTENA